MKKICCLSSLLCILLLNGCIQPSFNGSRTGNQDQLIKEYSIMNTEDSQLLTLQENDIVDVQIVSDAGKLSIIFQKNDETPIYEDNEISSSQSFQILIKEDGDYKVTVKGYRAKVSVSFIKS